MRLRGQAPKFFAEVREPMDEMHGQESYGQESADRSLGYAPLMAEFVRSAEAFAFPA